MNEIAKPLGKVNPVIPNNKQLKKRKYIRILHAPSSSPDTPQQPPKLPSHQQRILITKYKKGSRVNKSRRIRATTTTTNDPKQQQPSRRKLTLTLNGDLQPKLRHKQTSSISFVARTESKQYNHLPHVVYRPSKSSFHSILAPYEKEDIKRHFNEKLKGQKTAMLILPSSGYDRKINDYTLKNKSRLKLYEKYKESIIEYNSKTNKKVIVPDLFNIQPSRTGSWIYTDSVICLHYQLINLIENDDNNADGVNMNITLIDQIQPILTDADISKSNIQIVFANKSAVASKIDDKNDEDSNNIKRIRSSKSNNIIILDKTGNTTHSKTPTIHSTKSTTHSASGRKKICKIRCELHISESVYHEISNTLKMKLLHLIYLFETDMIKQLNKRIEGEKKSLVTKIYEQQQQQQQQQHVFKYRFVNSRDSFENKLYWIDTVLSSPTSLDQQSVEDDAICNNDNNNNNKIEKRNVAAVIKRRYYFSFPPQNYDTIKYREAIDTIELNTMNNVNGSSSSKSNRIKYNREEQNYRYPVGMTTYRNIFNENQLESLEKNVDETIDRIVNKQFLPNTYHQTRSKNGLNLVRTKMFFNARYLWGNDFKGLDKQLMQRANGIRVDVSKAPSWFHNELEKPLVDANIIPRDIVVRIPEQPEKFINSYACNVYHDGTCGLAAHYDDFDRFAQPITSLRLFSDCRLSFGSKTHAGLDSSFFVPMLRGDVTLMEPDGYAVSDIKHCVRPIDMTGKSAVLLLRRIHSCLLEEAFDINANECSQIFEAMHLKEEKWKMKGPVESLVSTKKRIQRDNVGSGILFAPRSRKKIKIKLKYDDEIVKIVVSQVLNECVEKVKFQHKIRPIYCIGNIKNKIQRKRLLLYKKRKKKYPYQCVYCTKRFDQYGLLKKHENNEHLNDVVITAMNDMVDFVENQRNRKKKVKVKKKREKLFICEFHCNFKGTYRDVLKHENDKHPNEIINKTMNDMILKVIKMNKGKKRKTSKSIKALRKRRLYFCEYNCNFKGTYRDMLKHENDKHPNEIIKKTMNDMILKVIKMNKGTKRKTSKSIKVLRKRRLYLKHNPNGKYECIYCGSRFRGTFKNVEKHEGVCSWKKV